MILCLRPSWTAVCHYSYSITDRCPRLSTSYILLFPSSAAFFTYILTHISIFRLCLSVFPEAVHHVSVSINMSHSLLVCTEAWGTDPRFSWRHESADITKAVGKVSNNGTILIITMSPLCGHFTCIVSNKLGHSSATYTAGTALPFLINTYDINSGGVKGNIPPAGMKPLIIITSWVCGLFF